MNKDINVKLAEDHYKIPKVHSPVIGSIVKSVLGFIAFICIGYYSLWLSTNYVKKETFDEYTKKQDQLIASRFDSIQNKLEVILNQQIITTEQFKNLNTILSTQQKSLDNISERVTFLERSLFKVQKDNQQNN